MEYRLKPRLARGVSIAAVSMFLVAGTTLASHALQTASTSSRTDSPLRGVGTVVPAGHIDSTIAALVGTPTVEPEGTANPEVIEASATSVGTGAFLNMRSVTHAADAASPEPSGSPEASHSPEPSETPEASHSPEPSETPEASHSPEPSETPDPSHTPEPSETPDPSGSPSGSGNGNGNGGGGNH